MACTVAGPQGPIFLPTGILERRLIEESPARPAKHTHTTKELKHVIRDESATTNRELFCRSFLTVLKIVQDSVLPIKATIYP